MLQSSYLSAKGLVIFLVPQLACPSSESFTELLVQRPLDGACVLSTLQFSKMPFLLVFLNSEILLTLSYSLLTETL